MPRSFHDTVLSTPALSFYIPLHPHRRNINKRFYVRRGSSTATQHPAPVAGIRQKSSSSACCRHIHTWVWGAREHIEYCALHIPLDREHSMLLGAVERECTSEMLSDGDECIYALFLLVDTSILPMSISTAKQVTAVVLGHMKRDKEERCTAWPNHGMGRRGRRKRAQAV